MPSPYITNFAGGVAPVPAFGQKDKIRFVGTWVAGDTWTIPITSTLEGDFTLGRGNIANEVATCGLKLRNRMYLGIGDSFALSTNGDVTLWEEQDIGAAVISFLSQQGSQDVIYALGTLQGRLAALAAQSIQIWTIDADPANFALQQVLDNTGTRSPLSVKAIGDLDLMYLDASGYRSVRSNQMYLNSTLSDIGTAIDLTVRAALVSYDPALACSIVEPTTKQYWGYLNGTIYVLSNYPTSKIVAWATYKPTYESTITPTVLTYTTVIGGIYYWTKSTDLSLVCGTTTLLADGGFVATAATAVAAAIPGFPSGTLKRVDTSFTPTKFVIYSGQIYCRGDDNKIYRYGGTDNNTFDHCRATVELPWLDNGHPSMTKHAQGVDAAISGAWSLYYGLDPSAALTSIGFERGSQVSPSSVADSTFDVGHFPINGNGTHIKLKMISSIAATPAKLDKLVFLYTKGNIK